VTLIRASVRKWRATALAVVATTLSLALYNLYCLRNLRVTRLRIAIPDLAPDLSGLRLAHLTDFHLGQSGTSIPLIETAVRQSLKFEPDLVALTGDYVDGPHSNRYSALFSRWPCDTSVIAVLGNHDYEHGEAHLADSIGMLRSNGVTVLRNEARKVRIRESDVWVAGLEDPFTLRDDIASAVAQVPSDERVLVLLAHAPVLQVLGDLHRTRIVLCGHTHGGQIRLLPSGRMPFPGLLRWLFREKGARRDPDLFRGWHLIGTAVLVISDGLGVSQLPIRFRTRPQLTLIELVQTPHLGASTAQAHESAGAVCGCPGAVSVDLPGKKQILSDESRTLPTGLQPQDGMID
jgi:hypothetical protein